MYDINKYGNSTEAWMCTDIGNLSGYICPCQVIELDVGGQIILWVKGACSCTRDILVPFFWKVLADFLIFKSDSLGKRH